MLKYYVTKYSLYASLSLTALHLTSHAYLGVENYARDRLSDLTSQVIESAAESYGYKIPDAPPQELGAYIDTLSRDRGVNPTLIHAIMEVESAGKQSAISHKSALGRMQIMPANAKRCGLKDWTDLADERKNLACGIQIIAEELVTYRGNVPAALQAYNGGPKCARGGCKESVDYVWKVLKAWGRA